MPSNYVFKKEYYAGEAQTILYTNYFVYCILEDKSTFNRLWIGQTVHVNNSQHIKRKGWITQIAMNPYFNAINASLKRLSSEDKDKIVSGDIEVLKGRLDIIGYLFDMPATLWYNKFGCFNEY